MKRGHVRVSRRQGALFQSEAELTAVVDETTARPIVEALAELLLEASGHARRREDEADEPEDQA
jgi:hypothetical protein